MVKKSGRRAPTSAAIWTGSIPTGRIRGSMASHPNRPIWPWRQPLRMPHSMKSVVRPELSTAAAGPSQAPPAAVDNSAPRSAHLEPTYKSGKTVQRTGTTSVTSLLNLEQLLSFLSYPDELRDVARARRLTKYSP